MSEAFIRREQAAGYLKQNYGTGSRATLVKFAVIGGGPTYHKIGRIPVYLVADLDAWATSRLSGPMRSTSDAEVL